MCGGTATSPGGEVDPRSERDGNATDIDGHAAHNECVQHQIKVTDLTPDWSPDQTPIARPTTSEHRHPVGGKAGQA
jgi:hypothetical protein